MHRTLVWTSLGLGLALLIGLLLVPWGEQPHEGQQTLAIRTPATPLPGVPSDEASEVILPYDLTAPTIPFCGDIFDEERPHVDLEPLSWTCAEPSEPAKPNPSDSGGRLPSLTKVNRTKPPPTAAEIAIRNAQEWLMHHQRADGSWSFDHSADNAHNGPVNNPGKLKSTTGATGLAMIALVRTPDTHVRQPMHREEVERGANYLRKWLGKNVAAQRHAGDLRGEEGDMLCQAWATIALCEAYAWTQDNSLKQSAQDAIHYLESVQHIDGGWGPSPGQPGECLLTSWSIQALKCGHLSYLEIQPKSIQRAITFLDSIQSDQGARYGSTRPDNGDAACTAAGLLCRMYLGRKRDDPPMARGVDYLNKLGPATNDVILNYYTNQVIFLWGVRDWKLWNEKLEPRMLTAQVRSGPYSAERGSWFARDERIGGAIGRLGYTALQSITLQHRFNLWSHRQPEGTGDDF